MIPTLRGPSTLPAIGMLTAALAAPASAGVVYDSLTGAQQVYSQCFVCDSGPSGAEIGDIITLAGQARSLSSVQIGVVQLPVTEGVAINAYTVDVSIGFYTVDAQLNLAPIAWRTASYELPSEGAYRLYMSVSGVQVPDTFFYGLSVTSTSPQVAGLRLSLWDYFDPAEFGDGNVIPLGTDLGTVVNGPTEITTQMFGRLPDDPTKAQLLDGLAWSGELGGFTPAVQISAVPEPQTYALLLVGGLALGLMHWRRNRQR